MAVTVPAFRAAFPAFADAAAYPDPEVQFWIDLGYKLHDPYRWGALLDDAVSLFVAHNLALEAMSSSSGGGGVPGAVVGPVSSASVDKVSYSRDARAALDPKAGHWNLTVWGLRWYRLMRMAGAGPVQVGVPPGGSNYGWGASAGWPGVVPPSQG